MSTADQGQRDSETVIELQRVREGVPASWLWLYSGEVGLGIGVGLEKRALGMQGELRSKA